MWWRAWRIYWSTIEIADEIWSSLCVARVWYVVVNCARPIWARCSIIRRMASAVSRLLTITILPRGHDHILNVVVDWKIYCRFLHFNFLLSTDQRRFGLLLRNRRRSMMIWISSPVNEIAHFWSMMIMMIARCSMSMMDASMRLTWILEMITTCRLP
jgi:hypothetical protein